MRKVLLLVLILLIPFLFPHHAFADDSFATAFSVNYAVNQSGSTHVIFDGTLTNTTDKYFASSYAITTGFTDASHILASDDDGNISPVVNDMNGLKKISLDFNHHALGIGKSVHFTIAFDTDNIAKHVGNMWEVAIPGIANQASFSDFTVKVTVPSSFGSLTLSKPQVSSNLVFTKDQLQNGGVFLAFGDGQEFDFTLDYHIQNNGVVPVKTDIALPPDTSYQKMYLTSLTPKPENVMQDADGNWLARYYLLPSERKTIVLTGSAILHLDPTPSSLSDADRQKYLSSQKYWEVSNSDIQKLAQDLKTPENIYDYVVTHLTYDFGRVTQNQDRLGAAQVLSHPQSAVCLEFTDLFVALSRAAGIPAREVDGYAYTQNSKERPLSLVQDILHAWPEYYDDTRQAWVMVDPTWGNTTHGIDYFHTFDFDHVAFVIKGMDSQYPIPAGGYKFDGTSRDVFVTPGAEKDFPATQVAVNMDTSSALFAGFPMSGLVSVTNLGPAFIASQQVLADNPADLMIIPNTFVLANIPPFGHQTTSLTVQSSPILTKKTLPITIHIGGATVTKTITLYPTYFSKPVLYVAIALILASIGLFILTVSARRLYISRRAR